MLFHDLSTDPARDVRFDLDRVVDFDGETGPYLQYAHTRCLGIQRKAGERRAPRTAPIGHPAEIAVVKALGMLPLQLERALRFSKASQLATYLIDVTRAFNAFYRDCKVLGGEPGVTEARLRLVEATRRVLGRGMALLGIPRPERM